MIYATGLLSNILSKKEKNIYCFGAGRVFEAFLKEFEGYNLEESIKAVVDNNPDVVKTSVKVVNGVSIALISFREMVESIESSEKILITTESFEEIIQQIEKSNVSGDINYYIYPVLRIEQYDYDRLHIKMPSQLSACDSIQIPKTIHYCWFGKKEMPVHYKRWMKSWKEYCPDYEIIEWNEKNYDVYKTPYISQAYEMEQWAFVSDYARIDIINEHGGIYLDIDVELTKNIDELLMNQAFCGFESSEYVNYGLGFGSQKHNPILHEIREYYDNLDFVQDDGTWNRTSCPVIQTKIMKRHGLECNGKFQIINGMAVYPSRVLCGMSPYSFRVERSPIHTYAIHHFSGSWMEDKREKNMLISAMKKWSRNDNYIYPSL